MLRLRFTSGLILGLVLGVPAGALIGLLVLPSRPTDSNAATSLQVQELTRRLEAAKDDKQRVDRQLEEFQRLAEQMTASFNSLEQRFKSLEEQRLREARPQPPPAPVAQAPAAPPPVPPPTPGTQAPAEPAAAMEPPAAAQQ